MVHDNCQKFGHVSLDMASFCFSEAQAQQLENKLSCNFARSSSHNFGWKLQSQVQRRVLHEIKVSGIIYIYIYITVKRDRCKKIPLTFIISRKNARLSFLISSFFLYIFYFLFNILYRIENRKYIEKTGN